ncbi:hypothetical protein HYX12_00170 [Candidatus Woesearchaeota archaeon]|nr:hypothetical protein [Candidatus Woesearchaeota archaeon]
MDKKAAGIVEILVLMIFVVVISGVILLLIQTGVITVKADGDYDSQEILNAEFLPLGREGYLAIKSFKFCESVSADYRCLGEKSSFNFGEPIYFLFQVETSTYEGKIIIAENYLLKDPLGKVILDVEAKNDFNFELNSRKEREIVAFKDYFTVYQGAPSGSYTLELVLENPLLGKKVVVTEEVRIG